MKNVHTRMFFKRLNAVIPVSVRLLGSLFLNINESRKPAFVLSIVFSISKLNRKMLAPKRSETIITCAAKIAIETLNVIKFEMQFINHCLKQRKFFCSVTKLCAPLTASRSFFEKARCAKINIFTASKKSAFPTILSCPCATLHQ